MERIIFDLDNTLISNVDFNIYVARAFEDLNLPYTLDDVKRIQKAIGAYEHVATKYDKETMLGYYRLYTNLDLQMNFINNFLEQLEYALPSSLESGVIETLEYLKSKYELSVLTNWFKSSQEARLKNAGLLQYIDQVYGGEENKKPSKEAYLRACGETSPSDVLMIGDSFIFDYEGAKRAGLNAILLDKKNSYSELGNERITEIKQLKKVL